MSLPHPSHRRHTTEPEASRFCLSLASNLVSVEDFRICGTSHYPNVHDDATMENPCRFRKGR